MKPVQGLPPSGWSKTVSAIIKPPKKEYWLEAQQHFNPEFFDYCQHVIEYLEENFGQGEVKSPDHLSLILDELPANYDYLSTWLAKAQKVINNGKRQLTNTQAKKYLAFKKQGNTDGTSKELAKVDDEVATLQEALDDEIYARDLVMGLKKSIAHYIDATRSQFSWEKQQQQYGRGQ